MMFKKVLYNIISIIVLATLFVGCATKRHVEYVDREVVKYKTKIQHDTLINSVHDSIRIERKGDTVFVDRWHTSEKERIENKTDTVFRDSIRTETKNVVVEKLKTPKWCYYLLAFSIIIIIFATIKIAKWLRR